MKIILGVGKNEGMYIREHNDLEKTIKEYERVEDMGQGYLLVIIGEK